MDEDEKEMKALQEYAKIERQNSMSKKE